MSTCINNTFETTAEYDSTINVTKPYRWTPDGTYTSPSAYERDRPSEQKIDCEECTGTLTSNDFESYCRQCGLIHNRRTFWHTSLNIEAKRRQFDHNSEKGSGTLQDKHATAVEDSVAATNFDGGQLDSWVYSLDQYNDGRDGHRGRENDVQKLDRERRFLKSRAEACATSVGLTDSQVREVVHLVTSINSGAFTSYGPARKGGGQDAHIAAAIAFVGNKYIIDLDDRVETRNEFQSLVADMGLVCANVSGAVSQLRKQLKG
ncbi:hypothetical protein [Halostagnicola bangensis]